MPTLWSIYMASVKALTRTNAIGDFRISPASYDGVILEKTIQGGPREGHIIRMVLTEADCAWLSNQLAEIFANARPDLVEPAP